MKKKLLAGLAVGLMVVGMSGVASAIPAVNFTSPTIDFSNFTDLVGWQFTVNNNITVDALGFYNNPTNGINLSHEIGIYDVATESLVVSATVSPSDPYSNWFKWTSVTPTVLTAGQAYDIVTILRGENRTWDPTGFTVDPNITYVKDVWSNYVYTLSFPNSTDPLPNGFFGPNFNIADAGGNAPVPEPATMLLMGTGLAGLAGTRLKRQK